jgi:small redox-active disulfide protein 2
MSGKSTANRKHVAVAKAANAIARRNENMIIKILGTGCPNCKKQEANVRQAVHDLGIDATIEKVENMQDIMAFGVMRLPALVVDGQVKSMGRVLSAEDVKKYL